MQKYTKINENIYRLVIPYKDIFTTVYLIKTEKGAVVFDTATYDEDIEEYVIPMLNELGVKENDLKYVFISHNHRDHAGGIKRFLSEFPKTVVVSRSEDLKNEYSEYEFLNPEDNDVLLDVLKVITIPGHTKDSSAILDLRDNILISGDSLQLYGIIGSEDWAANIRLPREHFDALNKLRKLDIDRIITAHDYYPCGYSYVGKDEINHALDMCFEPLYRLRDIILENIDEDDETIRKIYNEKKGIPTLRLPVVTAMRKAIENNEIK